MTVLQFSDAVYAIAKKYDGSVTSWGRTNARSKLVGGFAGDPPTWWLGMDIVYDDKCPSGEMYILNTDTISFYLHTVRNFMLDGPKSPANVDQSTYRLFTACQLVVDNCRLNARMTGLT